MSHAGLYIHIPFCQSKCGYCSFNSIPADRETADDYLATVEKQSATYSIHPQISGLIFDSIFFGGGTPTLASAERLGLLLSSLRSRFQFTEAPEISIEANPNGITTKNLQTLRQSGFNRLSFGIQSFQDDLLTKMERSHTGQQASLAVEMARDAGFKNLNCDLIYGLPGQTIGHWQHDLHTILKLAPEHLSLYELSVEPNTSFHHRQTAGSLTLPNDDALADMEDLSSAMLASTYDQYEISNYAHKNHQCQHNLTYWRNGTYLGLGAGAVSCLEGLRFSQQANPHLYMQAVEQGHSTLMDCESLSKTRRFRETIIMGLRLVQGVDLKSLEQLTGLNVQQVYGSLMDELLAKGHLQYCHPHLRIPKNFLGVANQILHQLV